MASETPLHLPAEILLFLYNEDMFTTHSVHELLWGYTDRFLNALHKFRPDIDSEFGYYKKVSFPSFKGRGRLSTFPLLPKANTCVCVFWGREKLNFHVSVLRMLETHASRFDVRNSSFVCVCVCFEDVRNSTLTQLILFCSSKLDHCLCMWIFAIRVLSKVSLLWFVM